MSDDSSNKPSAPKLWGVWGSLGFGALAFIVPQLAMSALAPFLLLVLPFTRNVQNFVLEAIVEALVILAITMIVQAYGHSLRSLGLQRMQWKFVGWALGGLIVYVLLTYALSFGASFFIHIDFDQVQDVGFHKPNALELLWVFVGLVVLPPLAEELLFRGFIFKGIRAHAPFWLTSLTVSVLFAAVHGQWNVGVDVFALSLVLCYLREKTNSLWPGIMLHGLKNFIAFLALFVYNLPQ